MQTLSANEVKRRGIIAAEELLSEGPVHILKNNKLTCVVLSEEDYQRLKQLTKTRKPMGLKEMLDKPATGNLTKAQAKKRLDKERSEWN